MMNTANTIGALFNSYVLRKPYLDWARMVR